MEFDEPARDAKMAEDGPPCPAVSCAPYRRKSYVTSSCAPVGGREGKRLVRVQTAGNGRCGRGTCSCDAKKGSHPDMAGELTLFIIFQLDAHASIVHSGMNDVESGMHKLVIVAQFLFQVLNPFLQMLPSLGPEIVETIAQANVRQKGFDETRTSCLQL